MVGPRTSDALHGRSHARRSPQPSHTTSVQSRTRLHGQSHRHHTRVGRRSPRTPQVLPAGTRLTRGTDAGGAYTCRVYRLRPLGPPRPAPWAPNTSMHSLRTLTPLRARTARLRKPARAAGPAPAAHACATPPLPHRQTPQRWQSHRTGTLVPRDFTQIKRHSRRRFFRFWKVMQI